MSLENIPSALFTVGSGGVVGFLIGFAIKRMMKILAVVMGIFLAALIYLESQSIINIDWQKLQSVSESGLSIVTNYISSTEQTSIITGNLGMPLIGGISAGLVLGFSKG